MGVQVSLKKTFHDFSLDVTWEIRNEIGVLFGYSGSGKSLTLQMIAGLVAPDSGRVQANGTPLYDSASSLFHPPQKRRLGYVLQDSSLFPHMTVRENILYGARDLLPDERQEAFVRLISEFELSGCQDKLPSQISGGQKQRVAFARALIGKPYALLLDEPFSALDNPIRARMRDVLRTIRDHFQVPIVLVTHDLFEAYTLADQLIIYHQGRVLQMDTPQRVFRHPATPEVEALVNTEEICKCTIFTPCSCSGKGAEKGSGGEKPPQTEHS